MRVVRENINFHIGKDPLKNLNIGLTGKWMGLQRGDFLKVKRDFTVDHGNHFNDNSKYREFTNSDQSEIYLQIETPPQAYPDGCIGITAYAAHLPSNSFKWRSSNDYFIWGTPKEFEERLSILNDIDEAQHFQRGRNPKDSMKIGRYGERNIRKALDKLAELRGGKYQIDFNKGQEYLEGKYFLSDQYKKVFRTDYFFIRFYRDPQEYFTYGYLINGVVVKERIIETVDEGVQEILKHLHPLPKMESINFERGMDPKRAMKIGKIIRPLKKGDKIKVWVPYEKRMIEVRISEDEETNPDGTPIIKKFYSSTNPTKEVRRIWVRYLGDIRTANMDINSDNPIWVLHV